ncbi:MAG: hypothetical protein EBW74_10305 [Betaproteobacteria bacterium]|nr:hypothetical protein [Betaproteobacteria bacterium]
MCIRDSNKCKDSQPIEAALRQAVRTHRQSLGTQRQATGAVVRVAKAHKAAEDGQVVDRWV